MLIYTACHIVFTHQQGNHIQDVNYFVQDVLPVVSATDAGVQPFAVVIKVFHTLVANTTVFNFRATKLKFITLVSFNTTFSWQENDLSTKSKITFEIYRFGYIHLDITQITAQVLDDMLLLCSVEKRHRTGIALFGPHTGICWVYSYCGNMGEEVHNKYDSCKLYPKIQGK